MNCTFCSRALQITDVFCSGCGRKVIRNTPCPSPTTIQIIPPTSSHPSHKKVNTMSILIVILLLIGITSGVFLMKNFKIDGSYFSLKTKVYTPLQSSPSEYPKVSTSPSKILTETQNTTRKEEPTEETSVKPISNYLSLVSLPPDKELQMGIFQMPKTGKLVETYKNVPIYDTGSRRFAAEELKLLKSMIDRLPPTYLETPPKGIVSVCCDDLKQFNMSNVLAVAYASGPYILLNDRMFKEGVWSSEHSENDKAFIFAHEYTHVVQYWHLLQEYIDNPLGDEPVQLGMKSSLVIDYAKKMGWGLGIYESVATPKITLYGDDISFAKVEDAVNWEYLNKDDFLWMGPSDYLHPAEDMATSFGYYIAGQGHIIGSKRQQYIQQFTGASMEGFVTGVVPMYFDTERGRFSEGDFTKEQTDELIRIGLTEIEKVQWFTQGKASFVDVVSFYLSELPKRGFVESSQISSSKGKRNEDYASGIYTYNGKTYLVSVIGFTEATGYAVKPDELIITVYTYK